MLHISKKKSENQPINIEIRNAFSSDALAVEMDEMWSYYHDKKHQSWLWWAIDHDTGTPLAFTFGARTGDMLYELI